MKTRKQKIKRILIYTLSIITIGILYSVFYNIFYTPKIPKQKVAEAIKFCKANHFDTHYCIFVDFSIHSGNKRYVIYDLQNKKIVFSSLCASGLNKNKFSNTPGSNLSSLGKYRVMNKFHNMYYGGYGIVVDGLESTNSNAKKRFILIHTCSTMNAIKHGIYPFPIMGSGISLGCFTISTDAMKKTLKLPKPTLLWAYK
jgi:hypothetical protein